MVKRSTDCPSDYELLMLPDLLRAARYWKQLSQRELAELAGLPKTTVDRIEAGQTVDPSLSTVQRLLAAASFGLIVMDENGEELSYSNAPPAHGDAAGRLLPAHLECRPIDDSWWGWYRIVWPDGPNAYRQPGVPQWIYRKRYPVDLAAYPLRRPELSRLGNEPAERWTGSGVAAEVSGSGPSEAR
jgi:transcriptional regulator with XRE-family HTH domain